MYSNQHHERHFIYFFQAVNLLVLHLEGKMCGGLSRAALFESRANFRLEGKYQYVILWAWRCMVPCTYFSHFGAFFLWLVQTTMEPHFYLLFYPVTKVRPNFLFSEHYNKFYKGHRKSKILHYKTRRLFGNCAYLIHGIHKCAAYSKAALILILCNILFFWKQIFYSFDSRYPLPR